MAKLTAAQANARRKKVYKTIKRNAERIIVEGCIKKLNDLDKQRILGEDISAAALFDTVIYAVRSQSSPKDSYIITPVDTNGLGYPVCTCVCFQFNGMCSHSMAVWIVENDGKKKPIKKTRAEEIREMLAEVPY